MTQPIKEHDIVALLHDLPEENLAAGEIGAVVVVHGGGEAFEVEFAGARDNGMGGVVTIEAANLLRLNNLQHFVRS